MTPAPVVIECLSAVGKVKDGADDRAGGSRTST